MWNIIFCMCHKKIAHWFKSTAVQWGDIWAKPEVMNGKQTIFAQKENKHIKY
jgi:hypothetical protein